VAAYHRNPPLMGWQEMSGISGRFGPEYPG